MGVRSQLLFMIFLSISPPIFADEVGQGIAQKAVASLTGAEECGDTRILQFRVHFKSSVIEKIYSRTFTQHFCEPLGPPPESVNAEIFFLDSAEKLIWSRKIFVSDLMAFDLFDQKRLNGGSRRIETTILQIKAPWNDVTRKANAIKIKLNNGKELGPIGI